MTFPSCNRGSPFPDEPTYGRSAVVSLMARTMASKVKGKAKDRFSKMAARHARKHQKWASKQVAKDLGIWQRLRAKAAQRRLSASQKTSLGMAKTLTSPKASPKTLNLGYRSPKVKVRKGRHTKRDRKGRFCR